VLGSDLHAPATRIRTDLRHAKITVLLLALAAALTAPAAALIGPPPARALPRGFFGIAPQTTLTDTDTAYMKAGGIGSVRWPISWATVQPTRKSGFNWSSVDPAVAAAARRGLTILPFIYGTPRWIAPKETTMPVLGGKARRAWQEFVTAAVDRYGPNGEFWNEHAPSQAAVNYVPAVPRPMPVRTWQVWNEANFFYFAYPVSPSRYAQLLRLTYTTIKAADPSAKVMLSGLFGNPDQSGKRAMDAADFLAKLYKVRGIRRYFDAVALHPYAFHVEDLEALTEEVREVVVENHDAATALYITEMGWGSQNDPKVVAFEQGTQGQARELRKAYRFLIAKRNALNLKGTYWYSWKDNPEYTACSFCDSVGLFRSGTKFRPKPAWRAFIAVTGGRARP
jgi:polysaccharide biosynthesis protein PslG